MPLLGLARALREAIGVDGCLWAREQDDDEQGIWVFADPANVARFRAWGAETFGDLAETDVWELTMPADPEWPWSFCPDPREPGGWFCEGEGVFPDALRLMDESELGSTPLEANAS